MGSRGGFRSVPASKALYIVHLAVCVRVQLAVRKQQFPKARLSDDAAQAQSCGEQANWDVSRGRGAELLIMQHRQSIWAAGSHTAWAWKACDEVCSPCHSERSTHHLGFCAAQPLPTKCPFSGVGCPGLKQHAGWFGNGQRLVIDS